MNRNKEFTVLCWHCGAPFNGFESPFCTHIDPTIVCPFCLKCSCDAPEKYKKDFIQNCPQELIDEKKLHREGRDLKLGEILLKIGKISKNQLLIAIEFQRKKKQPLGEIFVKMGLLTDDELKIILIDQKDLASINLDKFEIDFDLVEKIGKKICLNYKIIPMEMVNMNDQVILRFAIGSKEDLHRLKLVGGLDDIVLVPYLADNLKITHLLHEIQNQDILVLK